MTGEKADYPRWRKRAWVGFCAAMAIHLSVGVSAATSAADPIVTIAAGRIQGRVLDGGVTAYLGLPYAAAPVGALRWRPPAPEQAWQGTRQAASFGADCLQMPSAHPPGPGFVNPQSEDCLFLNVWVPPAAAHRPLPVMVWIHGGAWILGAGSWPTYNGQAFARDGVILVTINYRLGRLGFFSHPALSRASDGEPLSNYGLMDQVAALHWVHSNIEVFGGDPKRVTVFGESAGGRSVNLLMSMPAARGLFQRAISESGGGQDYLETRASAEQTGLTWTRSLGLKDTVSADELRAMSAKDVLDLKHFANFPLPAPVIDGRLVSRQVDAVFQAHQQAKVAYIAGFNSYEQSLLQWLPHALSKELDTLGNDRARAVAMYTEGGTVTPDHAETALYGEATRAAPARFNAGLVQDVGQSAWLYRYSYVPIAMRGRVPGAGHGAEIGLVFNNEGTPSTFGESAQDSAMAKAIHAYWVRFAKTGDPNGAGAVAWPSYTRANDALLQFTEQDIHVSHGYHADRLNLFDQVFLRQEPQH